MSLSVFSALLLGFTQAFFFFFLGGVGINVCFDLIPSEAEDGIAYGELFYSTVKKRQV